MSHIDDLIAQIKTLPPITDDDGNKQKVKLAKPPSAADRKALTEACGGKLPGDLAELLAITGGIELGPMAFRPEPERTFERDPAFLRASNSGNGDGLAIEPSAESTRVWWVGHDPYFLVYWAPSIEAFLELFIERAKTLAEDADVWAPRRESVEASVDPEDDDGDPELVAFVRGLPRGAMVHDLRSAIAGTEIPIEVLEAMGDDGELRRQGLLLGFVRGKGGSSSDERVIGPPALALSKATAGGGDWSASCDATTTIEVGVSSAGGASKGIYVEVGGPAFASGLVIAESASVGNGSGKRETAFTPRGAVARAELESIALPAAYVIDPNAKHPRPMPTILVRVALRGVKPGTNLLTVRIGPLGAQAGRGSALQGKRIVTR